MDHEDPYEKGERILAGKRKAALKFACPFCRAPPGEPCNTLLPNSTHMARHHEAEYPSRPQRKQE